MKNNEIEIAFGAKDSELIEATYHIPDGMEAIIEGDKVIIRKKESEDERTRKEIISLVLKVMGREKDNLNDENYDKMLDWLEKQSKENMIEALRLEYEKGKADALQEQRKEWNEEDERIKKNIKIALLSMDDNLKDFYYTHHTSKEECLDWLEKQGEQKLSNLESIGED